MSQYYAVVPPQFVKGKRVLVLGRDSEAAIDKLKSWGFEIDRDMKKFSDVKYTDAKIDFYYLSDLLVDDLEYMYYGWCIGKGIPELTNEFVKDIEKMEKEING